MENVNIYNSKENINKNQNIYDSFNNFIFSNDRDIFNKLYSRIYFYEQTKHLMGDIVECGVFKGSGIFTWLKILDLNEPNTIKKVIGFDFFDSTFVDKLNDDVDKDGMKQVFNRCQNLNKNDISKDIIANKILNGQFKDSKFELIKGDVSITSKQYLESRPGFRISILYMDLDLDEPTYNTLNNLWDNIVPGGIIVFDEYGYHCWSESNAVDRFIKEKKLEINKTIMKAPTSFIIKK